MMDPEFDQRADTGEPLPPVQVPAEVLSEDALNGLIEEFILREGTDYGREAASHEAKTKQIRRQLSEGKVVIAFDPNLESVTLLTENEWRKLTRK